MGMAVMVIMMLFNVDFGIANSIIGDWDTVMWLSIK